jgi:hypothetical protein
MGTWNRRESTNFQDMSPSNGTIRWGHGNDLIKVIRVKVGNIDGNMLYVFVRKNKEGNLMEG